MLANPLTLTYCYAGGTFTDCVWNRVSLAASGAYGVLINDIVGFTFIRNVFRAGTIRGHNSTYSTQITRANSCTFTDSRIIEGAMYFITCDGITVTGTQYCEAVSGTTVTTYSGYV